MQTVPISPHDSAPVEMTLGEISYRYAHHLDHVLRALGQPAIQGVEASSGCIRWFYIVSHPQMILPNHEVQVSRPLEQEALDEIAAEEDGD
jgi:hypothetical protein